MPVYKNNLNLAEEKLRNKIAADKEASAIRNSKMKADLKAGVSNAWNGFSGGVSSVYNIVTRKSAAPAVAADGRRRRKRSGSLKKKKRSDGRRRKRKSPSKKKSKKKSDGRRRRRKSPSKKRSSKKRSLY